MIGSYGSSAICVAVNMLIGVGFRVQLPLRNELNCSKLSGAISMALRKAKVHSQDNASKQMPSRHIHIALGLALAVALAVAVTHSPALDAKALTFDDHEYLIENQLIQHPSWASAGRFLTEVLEPSTVDGYYQPLAMISLMLDYAVAGRTDNLRPFHRMSLVLHIVNTLLLMGLLNILFGRPWIAAGVALLFGVHPMTVETIAWVGERKTLLATFFSLLCMLAYVRYTYRGGWKPYVACAVLYALALMSKPTSTPLPLVLLLLDFWPLRRFGKASVVEKMPLLLIAAISVVVTVVSQRHIESSQFSAITTGQTILLAFHNLIFYPCHMLWPTALSSLYPFPANISLSDAFLLTSTVTCLIMVVLLLISLRWTRALLVGWLCFFLLLAPTLLNKSYSPSVAWDKYAYLPVVGLLMTLTWFLTCVAGDPTKVRLRWRPVGLGIGIMASAALLIAGSRKYLQEWTTTERHEFYMLSLAPNSPVTHFGCGNLFQDTGQYERALHYYHRAISLKPDYLDAYLNRGFVYDSIGDYNRAFRDYDRAIELNPAYAEAYNNRGVTYRKIGEFDKAIRDFTKAIELMSGYSEAYSNRGVTYGDTHDYDRAIHDCTKAIAMNPYDAKAYNNRGNVYAGLRDYNRAIVEYNRATELKPDYAKAYYNRGNAYRELRDYDRAIEDYNRAVDLEPDYAEAYNNRGYTYNNIQNYDQAIRDCSKAIELKPDHAEAYNNRAVAYGNLGDFRQALDNCTKAVELKPDYAEAYSNRGNAFLGLQNYARAIQDYSMAIQLKPDHVKAYGNRAIAYYYTVEFKKAWSDIAKCRQFGGQVNPELIKALAKASSQPALGQPIDVRRLD